MVSFDDGNLNATRVRYGSGGIHRERLHPFRIHVQHVDDQVRGFFYAMEQINVSHSTRLRL